MLKKGALLRELGEPPELMERFAVIEEPKEYKDETGTWITVRLRKLGG